MVWRGGLGDDLEIMLILGGDVKEMRKRREGDEKRAYIPYKISPSSRHATLNITVVQNKERKIINILIKPQH